MTQEELHKLSFENEEKLLLSDRCGCFSCGRIFNPKEIKEWIKDRNGRTAICPYCGIDSVLQEASNGEYILDEKLLKEMNQTWFNGSGFEATIECENTK